MKCHITQQVVPNQREKVAKVREDQLPHIQEAKIQKGKEEGQPRRRHLQNDRKILGKGTHVGDEQQPKRQRKKLRRTRPEVLTMT